MGSVFTATQERAGLFTKYFAYTSLNAAKSSMLLRKHVVLIAFSTLVPAASSTAVRFLHTCSVCSVILLPTICPSVLSGICPDVNTRLPVTIA